MTVMSACRFRIATLIRRRHSGSFERTPIAMWYSMRAAPGSLFSGIRVRGSACIRSLSRIRALVPLAGALRRLRIAGGVGIVFGYSRDEPASGERLQVRLQRVSNLLGIDLPVVHVERKGFQIFFRLRRIFAR